MDEILSMKMEYGQQLLPAPGQFGNNGRFINLKVELGLTTLA